MNSKEANAYFKVQTIKQALIMTVPEKSQCYNIINYKNMHKYDFM